MGRQQAGEGDIEKCRAAADGDEADKLGYALNAAGASVSFVEIETDKGHDAFLLEEPTLFATTRGFLDAAAAARGLGREGAA